MITTERLIQYQAILDCGIVTRDVLRRLRDGALHESLLQLPTDMAGPWRTALGMEGRYAALVRMNNMLPVFAKDFSNNLSSMIEAENTAHQSGPVSASLLVQLTGKAPLSADAVKLIDSLATVIERISSQSQKKMREMLCNFNGIYKDHSLSPELFCAAWYQTLKEKISVESDLHSLYKILGFPFASAMHDSYVAYSRLSKEWYGTTELKFLDFQVTIPTIYPGAKAF